MRHFFTWRYFFQRPRVLKYKLLSDIKKITGKAIYNQPALLIGKGSVSFGKNVQLGYYPSPFFYSGYIHLESRTPQASIEIGNNVYINNNFFAISESAGIEIGDNALIGINCEIIDSDFHDLSPAKRATGTGVSEKVIIGKNVFLGNNVKITKGVTIGDNSVIANGALVVSSFPANVIIGGVPAKIIGSI